MAKSEPFVFERTHEREKKSLLKLFPSREEMVNLKIVITQKNLLQAVRIIEKCLWFCQNNHESPERIFSRFRPEKVSCPLCRSFNISSKLSK